jgi:hypothetical protein
MVVDRSPKTALAPHIPTSKLAHQVISAPGGLRADLSLEAPAR